VSQRSSAPSKVLLVNCTCHPYEPIPQARKQYARAITILLARPTAHTAELLSCALAGLRKIYRPGYIYAKAGVILRPVTLAQGAEHWDCDRLVYARRRSADGHGCLKSSFRSRYGGHQDAQERALHGGGGRCAKSAELPATPRSGRPRARACVVAERRRSKAEFDKKLR